MIKSVFLIPFVLFQFFSWPWSRILPYSSLEAILTVSSGERMRADFESDTSDVQEELARKLLRLHVVAASDRPGDQHTKLQVKEKAVSLLGELLEFCSCKEEAMAKIKENLPVLQDELRQFLDSIGCTQRVSLSLDKRYFPVKLYGNLVFPAGVYDALLIVLESGEGANWWCVLYPPLCLSDLCTAPVPQKSEETLHSVLSDEAWETIQADDSSDPEPEKPHPLRVRFWFVDFFHALFS